MTMMSTTTTTSKTTKKRVTFSAVAADSIRHFESENTELSSQLFYQPQDYIHFRADARLEKARQRQNRKKEMLLRNQARRISHFHMNKLSRTAMPLPLPERPSPSFQPAVKPRGCALMA
ncbi:expressed unknown protein [Seminavis robusta]|uniref:Uncharacterized protein n=1 Tax=Seminavis robusta TaxID=568900 RepID=A0A9N8HCF1_9STRA|nr:expressed unknown protein [Seminavis robusta]|eukprot:Sro406_g136410.1 n/a (119) ;mRNA; r:35467-35823